MIGITEPLPGLSDDPQLQGSNLPALLGFQIAPLRDPAPIRHGADIPTPLEPSTDSQIHHASTSRSNRPSHRSQPPPPTASARAGLHRDAGSTITGPEHSDKKKSMTSISPSDVLSARESKKPHMAISELVEATESTDVVPTQLPSFISLATVEKSPVQTHSFIPTTSSRTDGQPAQKRLRMDIEADFAPHGSTRYLPLPERREERIARPAPLLPTMVTGLHEPPPSAALLPSMEWRGTSSRIEVRDILADLSSGSPTPPSQKYGRDEGPDANKSQDTTPTAKRSSIQLEHIANPSSSSIPLSVKKVRRIRRKWSKQETNDLTVGVQRHGIGKWKQILDDPALTFYDRNAVDLKDRYRVCAKDVSRVSHIVEPKNGSTKGEIIMSDTSDQDEVKKPPPSKKSNHSTSLSNTNPEASTVPTSPEDPHQPKITETPPPRPPKRRKRRLWTTQEDASLLQGVSRHGFQWTLIHADPDLGLDHRKATDLRDRIRSRFPEGYKHAETAPFRSEQRKIDKGDVSAKVDQGLSMVRGKKSDLGRDLEMSKAGGVKGKVKRMSTDGISTNTNTSLVGPPREATVPIRSIPGICGQLSTNPATENSASSSTAATAAETEKDQPGVTLPSLTLADDDGLDWEDNRLPPLLEWDDIGL